MKDINKQKERIEEFFNGEMDSAAIEKFEKQCRKDPELQVLLDEKSGLEALLLEHKGEHAAGGHYAGGHYNDMIDEILYSKEKQHIISRNSIWLRVYAIAATLLVVLSGSLLLQKNLVKYQLEHTVKKTEYIPENITIPQSGKSIARIADNAFMVSEEGTRVKVLESGDSAATIIIAQGNVSLDVRGTTVNTYTVVTPHMAVTLHGTVVRLVVTELETELNVLEGSVAIVHRYDHSVTRELEAGHIVFADCKSLKTETRLTPEVCESRIEMLRAYVRWIEEQKNG